MSFLATRKVLYGVCCVLRPITCMHVLYGVCCVVCPIACTSFYLYACTLWCVPCSVVVTRRKRVEDVLLLVCSVLCSKSYYLYPCTQWCSV